MTLSLPGVKTDDAGLTLTYSREARKRNNGEQANLVAIYCKFDENACNGSQRAPQRAELASITRRLETEDAWRRFCLYLSLCVSSNNLEYFHCVSDVLHSLPSAPADCQGLLRFQGKNVHCLRKHWVSEDELREEG